MKFRIFVTLMVVLLVVIIGAVYVAATSASDLIAARRALQGDVADLELDEIEDARARLASASERLDGIVASVIGVVPVVGQNLGALEAVADGAGPVLDAAADLKTTIDETQKQELVRNGRVRLDLVDRISGLLAEQAEALEGLRERLSDARSGWLLPPVHEELGDLLERASDLSATASKARAAAQLAPDMLGGAGRRTYLVVLVNNAELRGAGGILSGAGTVTVTDGRIALGDFSPHTKLETSPLLRVPAPPEYMRRFGYAKPNTTLWLNTTYSPEVPDVALVASRLYDKVRNIATDGAIVVDPRGIAALMPPGASVGTPAGGEVNADTLPEYIYSTAYDELGGGTDVRRESLLAIGRDVFKLLAERGPGGVNEVDGLAAAVSGGHLRFVSFDEDEQALLERMGAAGSLPDDGIDTAFVNVQNHGADKLDFWVERSFEHSCALDYSEAVCGTQVTLTNNAPRKLSRYVAPRRNNETNEFLEIYVPGDAEVSAVELDGKPAQFLPDTHGDLRTVGVDVGIERGESTTLTVSYTLPLDGEYDLTVVPQPLAKDASVRVELEVPGDWTVAGPDGSEEGGLIYDDDLTGTLRFEAAPTERSGLARAWEALSDFWNEEVI
jgi:hypothetical protein